MEQEPGGLDNVPACSARHSTTVCPRSQMQKLRSHLPFAVRRKGPTVVKTEKRPSVRFWP